MKLKLNKTLLLLVVLVAQITFAQERTVSGVVSDNTGMTLPGVSVLVKGTKSGTLTDFDGKYTIKATPSQVLVFSYIGMKTQEAKANSTKIDIKLTDDTVGLDIVVVTGTAKGKSIKEMTYSIGMVNSSTLEKVPAMDAISALQGKVSGLKINSSTGEPGSDVAVQLRSANSLSTGQKPLIILDGVIIEGGLADINTLDIERIEVVKGAAGASLYGSRAASGVIQIFSKRGKGLDGKSRITYRTETGFNTITNKLDLTTKHRYELTPDGTDFAYDSTDNRIVEADNLGDNPYPSKYKLYDLQDRIFRTGQFTSHHLALEGGKDATNFLFSYDRQDSKSVIELTDTYSRNNFRINIDHKVSDKFKIGASMVYANSKRDPFVTGQSGVLFDAIILEPISNLDALNTDGTPYLFQPSEFATTEQNPLYIIANNERGEVRNRFIGSYNAAYDVTSWFKATAEYSIDFEQSNFIDFFDKGYLSSKPRLNLSNGYIAKANFYGKAENFRTEGLFTKSVGDFNSNLKVGFLDERYYNDFNRTEAPGIAASGIKTLDNILNSSVKQTSSRSLEIITNSYYAVLEADYLKKALISVAFRTEGSSLFGKNTRWNNYFRASGAYRLITNASDIKGIEEFKLRASVGTAGNRPLYGMRDETYTLTNGSASKSTTVNENLKPSIATEIELGFNISFLKRFNAEFNYIKTNTKDQILFTPLSGIQGFEAKWDNAGEMEATSYEASLGANIVKNKNWNWDLNILWDKSSQKVKTLNVPSYYTGPGTQESDFFLVAEGENFGAMYGDKFITSFNDLPTGSNQANYSINSRGYVVTTSTGLPVKYRDETGNSNVKIGDINPDFNMSFSSNLKYKNFALYALVYWKKGGDIYNKVKQWLYRDSRSVDLESGGLTDDFYQGLYNVNAASSAFVEDGSYVRLKELSLYYTLSKENLGQKIKFINEIKFGIIGRNLLTSTNYSGQDPEISAPAENNRTELTSRSSDGVGSSSNNPGGDPNVFKVDSFSYPTLKSFSFSVQFKF